MQPCFKFTAKAGDKPAILAIDEEIGFWGVQAKDFRDQLSKVEGDLLEVQVNSVGGEVMAGLGIYNMLRSWAKDGKTVHTRVTGIAASIASVITLAGDKREMPKNAFAMTHAASGLTWGTAEDMRETAEVLDKIDGSIRGIYMDRMGIPEAKAKEIMAKDTWLTADECKELGFATAVTDAVQATAKFDVERLDLPQGATLFKAQAAPEPAPAPKPVDPPAPSPAPVDPPVPPTAASALIDQIKAKAKEAGFEAFGDTFALACNTLADAEARISQAKDITALCKLAGRDKDAAKAINAGTSVSEVRMQLLKAKAAADPDIDGANPDVNKPKAAGGDAAPIEPTALWQSHNAQNPKTKGR